MDNQQGITGVEGETRASSSTPSTGATGGQTKTVRRRRKPTGAAAHRRTRTSLSTPNIGSTSGSQNSSLTIRQATALGGFFGECQRLGMNRNQINSLLKNYEAQYVTW